ncbi:hepatitis A virus cellular receptor 1-like isoform X2 [Leucoraja erinacea]|uniref:hepatitis A virus cellular receptor 1-like isoform X2 n=1 Tax=Leucoraja erinaceus TaxID=7782 RepID=UPI00245761E3|nr:hepatitis A virus cellular receptor 1-like isoform X2 [Leucoraja erinacea]
MMILSTWLPTVLLLVSVHGNTATADAVFAVEGGSAVLPCTFTLPATDHIIKLKLHWFKGDLRRLDAVITCQFTAPFHSSCDEVKHEARRDRFKFIGNLSRRDASLKVEQLGQEDNGLYQCNVNNIDGHPLLQKVIHLTVRARNVSLVTGTEGASATLPCVFSPPLPRHMPRTVTWMRKDRYRQIVAFRPQADRSWAAENGTTRFELVGNPEQGNASTRIKQLRVEDSDGYLCLVFSTDHLFQCEIQLQVATAPQFSNTLILYIALGVKSLVLLVMGFILIRDKTRRNRD